MIRLNVFNEIGKDERSFYVDQEFYFEDFMRNLAENTERFVSDLRDCFGSYLRTFDDFIIDFNYKRNRGSKKGKARTCKFCGCVFTFREKSVEKNECPFCFSVLKE